MITALCGLFAAAVFARLSGDNTTAALITVAGTLVNTALILTNHRNVRHIRATITAPRRIIYNENGDPIGTVIDLERAGGWDNWLVRHNRRANDESSPEPLP